MARLSGCLPAAMCVALVLLLGLAAASAQDGGEWLTVIMISNSDNSSAGMHGCLVWLAVIVQLNTWTPCGDGRSCCLQRLRLPPV
jgi:hypothetical protein